MIILLKNAMYFIVFYKFNNLKLYVISNSNSRSLYLLYT